MESFQDPKWLEFYEKAWAERLEILNQIQSENPALSKYAISLEFKRREANKLRYATKEGSELITRDSETPQFPWGIPYTKTVTCPGGHTLSPWYSSSIDMICDAIKHYGPDNIIELGSGLGDNLIEITEKLGLFEQNLYAGEYTDSGRQCTEFLNPSAKVFFFDWKSPLLSKRPGKTLLFSVHSIEQVTNVPENLMRNLSSAGDEVIGIHVEPFGYQIHLGEEKNLLSEQQSDYFKKNNWNQNFAEVFFKAQERGEIEIITCLKDIFPGEPCNPSSVLIWKPKSTQ